MKKALLFFCFITLFKLPLNAVVTRSQSPEALDIAALKQACSNNHKEPLELLFAAKNEELNENYYTLLRHCVEQGSLKCLNTLLNHAPEPLEESDELLVPWSVWVVHNSKHCLCINALLKKQANFSALAENELPLHMAAGAGCLTCVENLCHYLLHTLSINHVWPHLLQKDSDGFTALARARASFNLFRHDQARQAGFDSCEQFLFRTKLELSNQLTRDLLLGCNL
ncbi:ankyrin repeat domain-containing protein [Candidatus Babeliales bacterium]|nr:ankyrin repeat domain-containing protein [Candidatus Babeliales bacterium]